MGVEAAVQGKKTVAQPRPGSRLGQTSAVLEPSAHDQLMKWLKIVQPWTLTAAGRGVGRQDGVDELGELPGPNSASMTQFPRHRQVT